jgi:hypothetical protein
MTTKTKSIKVPPKTVGELLFKTNLQCCVCKNRGQQIHHLNGNKYDHRIDNLAYLCITPCHDEATKTGGLSRKLNRETIINFREHHYQTVKNARQKELGTFDHPIPELTEEKLLTASKNALIIIELERIKEEYFSASWDKRVEILGQLSKFTNHSNHRLALDIFEFLSLIAYQTRGGMTYNMACSIFGTILDFFQSLHDEENRIQSIQLAKTCIHIGDNIAYDSFIHLRNIAVAMWGLTIMKFIYRSAKENEINELMNEVNQAYDRLESTLHRPERNDLGDAKEMVKIFREDLNEWDLAFPLLTEHLMKRLSIDEKK